MLLKKSTKKRIAEFISYTGKVVLTLVVQQRNGVWQIVLSHVSHQDVLHRQIVFTIPKRLRVFFKFDRRLIGDLCRVALRSLERFLEAVTGGSITPGVIALMNLSRFIRSRRA